MTQQPHMSRNPRRAVFGLLTVVALIALLAGCSPAAPAPAVQPTTAPVQPTDAPAQPAAQSGAAATFAKDVQPILQQSCVKCHGNSAAGGLSLTSYANLMKGGRDGQVIVPGDAADSELVKVIVSGRMPQGGKKLSQSQIDIISAWVTAGAKDN